MWQSCYKPKTSSERYAKFKQKLIFHAEKYDGFRKKKLSKSKRLETRKNSQWQKKGNSWKRNTNEIEKDNNVRLKSFSDGAASQFKQRFILSSLNHIKSANNLENLGWIFFASSNSQGAVDGVGGSVKKLVWQFVEARKETVANAAEFFL